MLERIKSMAVEAGKMCLEASADMTKIKIEHKGTTDMVTEVDKKVEDFLVSSIRKHFPDHTIVGEERGTSGTGDCRWCIDPIDGTNSFIQGLPGYCVSIAYEEQDGRRIGVIYAPVLEQLFYSEKGQGAYLNNRRLHVSQTSRMIESVWATGFACIRAGSSRNNLLNFSRILPQIRDIRRMGSAALDLAYVAAGKLDGFWEMDLKVYDIAAGVLLVEEAGGVVCDFTGEQNYPANGLLACNGILVSPLMAMLD